MQCFYSSTKLFEHCGATVSGEAMLDVENCVWVIGTILSAQNVSIQISVSEGLWTYSTRHCTNRLLTTILPRLVHLS